LHKFPHDLWIAGLLLLVSTACTGILPTEEPSVAPVQFFEGFYFSGPDISSFVTCEMDEPPGAGKGYWLLPDDEFSRLYENPDGISIGDIATTYGPYDQFAIYVRFEGILSAESEKGYGHTGLYVGEIRVTKVLEVSRRWVGSTNLPRSFKGCAN